MPPSDLWANRTSVTSSVDSLPLLLIQVLPIVLVLPFACYLFIQSWSIWWYTVIIVVLCCGWLLFCTLQITRKKFTILHVFPGRKMSQKALSCLSKIVIPPKQNRYRTVIYNFCCLEKKLLWTRNRHYWQQGLCLFKPTLNRILENKLHFCMSEYVT
jgi:hypothetical protein